LYWQNCAFASGADFYEHVVRLGFVDPAVFGNIHRNFTMANSQEEALKTLEEEAKRGDTEKQAALGGALWKEDANLETKERSVYWLRRAADSGHAKSRCALGHALLKISILKNSPSMVNEAMDSFRIAINNNDTDAYFGMGKIYHGHFFSEFRDLRKAAEFYGKAVELGDRTGESEVYLAKMLIDGEGVDQKDFQRAEQLLRSASGKRNIGAVFALSQLFLDHEFPESKKAEGFLLLRQAAELNDIYAQVLLGTKLLRGSPECSINIPEGLNWLRRMAKHNLITNDSPLDLEGVLA
jgi:TPR repeat protein